jgi:hypothetical protein|tara:strand:- start:47 stop:520 length:474 start_codon:yes stop_codon:yes gene_type:complete
MDQVKTADKAQNRLSRELETRAAMQRPTSWQAPETLPSPNPRPGISHRWVRTSMLGVADVQNISGKLREGYEPVKAEDYPELSMNASTDGRFKGSIEAPGLVLCSIPTEFLKQREAHFSKINKDTMESVDNNFMKDSHPTMSKFSEKSTKVTFGSGT